MPKQQILLWGEFILLFGGVPLLAIGAPRGLKFMLLWLFVLYAITMLRHVPGLNARKEWNWQVGWQGFRKILFRTVFGCCALTLLTVLVSPERLLSFPLGRPQLWMMVMIWYPIISVLPQEIIYRSLFFHRYAQLFKKQNAQILASAIAFGWGHIMFLNWVAVILCTIGGILFSHSYVRHRSLATAWLEHSIYGCFLFTIGLGAYFYGASVRI